MLEVPLPLRRTGQLLPADRHSITVTAGGHALMLAPALADRGTRTLVEHDGQLLRSIELPLQELAMRFPKVQAFSSGDILAVDSRCERGDQNGAIFSPDGTLLRRFSAGDGIEHVRVDAEDNIWVAYFDEGIFGDEPLGPNGLNRFNARGDLTWSFAHPDDEPDIADCYALTVGDTGVWAYWYDSFPIVQIIDGRPTFWHTELTGARTLVADGERALLVGGYSDQADRAVVLRLVGDLAIPERYFRITLPVGERRIATVGAGRTLHVFSDAGTWYQADLDDLARF